MLAERFWSEDRFPVVYEDNHPKAVMVDMDIVFIPSFRRSIRKLKKRFPGVKKDVRLAIDKSGFQVSKRM